MNALKSIGQSVSWNSFKLDDTSEEFPNDLHNLLSGKNICVHYKYIQGYGVYVDDPDEVVWVSQYIDSYQNGIPGRVEVELLVIDQNRDVHDIPSFFLTGSNIVSPCHANESIRCSAGTVLIAHESTPCLYYELTFQKWTGDQAMIEDRRNTSTRIINVPKRSITLYAKCNLEMKFLE